MHVLRIFGSLSVITKQNLFESRFCVRLLMYPIYKVELEKKGENAVIPQYCCT